MHTWQKIRLRCSVRKRSFTLIEVMLVLVLLLGVAGAVTINYSAALSRARFEADVKGVWALLRSAEEAMLVGFDPFLSLSTTEKGITILLQEAGGGFPKKEFFFPAIKRLTFNGQETPQRLLFGSKGALYPEGKILLEGDEKVEIDLFSTIEKITADSQGDLPYPLWVKEKFKAAATK